MQYTLNKTRVRKSHVLTMSATLVALLPFLPASGPASAQGISEYGGLMAMPKGVPSGNMAGGLSRLYNAGATPQAVLSEQQAAYSLGLTDVKPPDPKKIKAQTIKSVDLFKNAKVKMASPTPANLGEAAKMLREAISIRNSIWGYQDPAIPQMLNMLAEVYIKQKYFPQAEACYHNAQVYITKRSGPGSYERFDALLGLARLQESLKNYKGAASNYRQIVVIDERLNRAADPRAVARQVSLLNCLALANDPGFGDAQKSFVDKVDKLIARKDISEKESEALKALKTEGTNVAVQTTETPPAADAKPPIAADPVDDAKNAVPK